MKFGLFSLLALTAACSILPDPKSADIKYCAVDPGAHSKVEKTLSARLSIRPFSAPARYSHAIVVRPDPYQVVYRQEMRWVETPPELAQAAMEQMIRTSELFRPRENDPEWQLEGRVLAFDQVHAGDQAFAEAAVRFELYRRRGGEKIWETMLSARAPIQEDRLAEAMSQALRQLGEQLVAALQQADLK